MDSKKQGEAVAIIEARKSELLGYIQVICRDHILWAKHCMKDGWEVKMPTETYLARERARRCVLCEQGHRRGIYENCQQHWVLVASAHCHKWKPCTAPPDAALYEELAKERDELRADFDWLDAMPIMEQMERTIVQSDGSYPMWRIKRAWRGEQGEGKTLREAIRAAREKEKA